MDGYISSKRKLNAWQAYVLDRGTSNTCLIAFGDYIRLLVSVLGLGEAHSSSILPYSGVTSVSGGGRYCLNISKGCV